MRVTEEEARTKWCPFVKMPWFADTASDKRPGPWYCIASQCMAWRWQDPYNLTNQPDYQRHGRCGMSGEGFHDD